MIKKFLNNLLQAFGYILIALSNLYNDFLLITAQMIIGILIVRYSLFKEFKENDYK